MSKPNKLKTITVELINHLPYSIFGVTLGLLAMGFLTFFAILLGAEERLALASEELFHLFHPAHVLISAVASTAMFCKHEKRWGKAVIVGSVGTLVICAVSDVIFPFIGGFLLGADMHIHVCLFEEPGLLLPFLAVGVLAGLTLSKNIENSTEYSHSAHVFISSMASILYLLAYGVQDWIHMLGGIFCVIIVAVMIPCCLSDIAFPMFCVHRNCQHD